MSKLLPVALALVLPLAAACLENEEQIEIRPDGSVRLTVVARGDAADLAEGYPVPLEAPWELASVDAKRWVERFGASTGSPEVRARLDEIGWGVKDNDEIELQVTRELPSVDALPRWYASERDPYHEAYLERGASLKILERGERKVYVFERTFHGRLGERFDPLKRLGAVLEEHEDELEQLDDGDALPPELWDRVATTLHDTYREMAELYARRSLEGLYTRGDASLPPQRLPELVASVVDAVAAVVSRQRLDGIYALYLQDDDAAGEAFETMAAEIRQTLRNTLTAGLAEDGMNRATINAVLFELESSFTAVDHDSDLGDEDFRVVVEMPGEIVSGNFDSTDGWTATWTFDGDKIGENGKVLRVVSVLE